MTTVLIISQGPCSPGAAHSQGGGKHAAKVHQGSDRIHESADRGTVLPPIRQHRVDNSPQTLLPHPPMRRGEPPDNPWPCAHHMRPRQKHVPNLPHPPHPAQHHVRGGVEVPIPQGVTPPAANKKRAPCSSPRPCAPGPPKSLPARTPPR